MARPSRESRESQSRTKVWSPPQKLATPPAPEGYKYRWVRRMIRGEDDIENILSRQAQHYEPVRPDQVQMDNVRTLEDGKHAGVVVKGDLMLTQVPLDVVEQRNDYYDNKARSMQAAVDNDLMKESTKEMPIYKKRGTRVQLGVRKTQFESDSGDEF